MAVAILLLLPPFPLPELARQACLLGRVENADTWVTGRSGLGTWLEESLLIGSGKE